MTTSHANCDHEMTKAGRAACRKAKAAAANLRDAQVADLLATFNTGYQPRPNHWVWYAAGHFGGYRGTDLVEAANAILDYFLPSGDEARDAGRRRNGYTITDSTRTMLSITCRAAS